MRLPDFQLERPESLAAAVAVAGESKPGEFDFLGGGTDLLCNYKWHINTRPTVISLRHLPELRESAAGVIGAGITLWDLEHDEAVAAAYPAICEAARQIATPIIRRTATLGGNLLLDTRCWHFNQTSDWRVAHGSCLKAEANICRVVPDPGDSCVAAYSGDLAPVLLAYGATLVLESAAGRREVPIERFYSPDGIRRFRDKRPDEILVHVRLADDATQWTVAYQKLRLRQAFDFPEGGVAAGVRVENGAVVEARITTTAYATIPELLTEAAQPLVGSKLDDDVIEAVANDVEARVQPMKNTSMAPSYRKKMARVLARRAMIACRERAGLV